MKPEFATAVDPIFEYVLGLLDRIEQGSEPDPQQIQAYLHGHLLNTAEQHLGHFAQEWRPTKYALVSWIDEMLTNAHWRGRDWWINNPLEFQIFKSGERAIQFYVNAQQLTGAAALNALEVYYLCVILGFRGIYERPEENVLDISGHGLPAKIEEWLRRTGEGIRLAPIAPLALTGRQPLGAPPLGGLAFMTSSVILLFIAIAALAAVVFIRLLPANTGSG